VTIQLLFQLRLPLWCSCPLGLRLVLNAGAVICSLKELAERDHNKKWSLKPSQVAKIDDLRRASSAADNIGHVATALALVPLAPLPVEYPMAVASATLSMIGSEMKLRSLWAMTDAMESSSTWNP